MAEIIEGIKPTRMELLKLRKRVVLAEKGHRLLKEKRDALITEFLNVVSTVRTARQEAENQLARAYEDLLSAQALMGSGKVRQISQNTDQDIQVDIRTRNIMGVTVPLLETGKIRA